MRWYVSRNGQTVGPVDEAEIRNWPPGSLIGAHLRDEAGGAWTPAEHSPFAAYVLPPPVVAQPVSDTTGRALLVVLACGAMMFGSCYYVANASGCGKDHTPTRAREPEPPTIIKPALD
jgi:hypothetical protein